MRGEDEWSGSLFSYVDLEARITRCGPSAASRTRRWRRFRASFRRFMPGWVDLDPAREASAGDAVAGVLLDPLGASVDGAAGIDLLFRWFVGIGVDDAGWDHSTFSKNRERLLEADVAGKLLSAVLAQPMVKRLLIFRSTAR